MGFQKNTAQVEQLLMDHYEKYYRLAYSYVQNEHDALDVVQDSAYRAIKDCGKVKNTDYLATWIYRIVINTALDVLRKKKREVLTEELPDIPANDQYHDTELRATLDRLEHKSRTVIILRYFEDMKLEDIADIVGENLNTVKARLYRALKKLRLDMEAEQYGELLEKRTTGKALERSLVHESGE